MEGWSRSWSRRGSRRGSRNYVESEHEANLAWDKLGKVREKMGKDLRTVTKIEEKINDISKRLTKPSKGKSIWKRSKTPKQTVVELKEMESKLIGIKNRFGLLISHSEIHGNRHVTNIDELRHKVNLIEVIAAQITELLQTFDDIGQSSTQQQFESPDFEQFQSRGINYTNNPGIIINPYPHHVDDDDIGQSSTQQQQQQFEAPDFQQFQALNINPNPDYVDDNDNDDWKIDNLMGMVHTLLANEPRVQRKFMDVRALCDNALGYVRSNMGMDYEFVAFATYLIPTFSSAYGDGLHFNFFARQKAARHYSPAQLFFVDVANGDPQTIIRCVPLLNQHYSLDDEDRPSLSIVYHPDDEYCVYCDHAKDGSLERNFCLAPPLM